MTLPIEAILETVTYLGIGIAGYYFGRIRTTNEQIEVMERSLEAMFHVAGFGRVLERNGLLDAGYEEVKEVAKEHGYEFSEREWKFNP